MNLYWVPHSTTVNCDTVCLKYMYVLELPSVKICCMPLTVLIMESYGGEESWAQNINLTVFSMSLWLNFAFLALPWSLAAKTVMAMFSRFIVFVTFSATEAVCILFVFIEGRNYLCFLPVFHHSSCDLSKII